MSIRRFSIFQKDVHMSMLVEVNSQSYLIQGCCPATCFSSGNIINKIFKYYILEYGFKD